MNSSLSTRINIFIAILLVTIFTIYYFNNNFKNEHKIITFPEFTKDIEKRLLKWRDDGKLCLQNRESFLEGIRKRQEELLNNWEKTNVGFRDKWVLLSGLYDTKKIPFKLFNKFVSDSENKYYLPFIDDQVSCNVFTLGVGMDYRGEEEFWQRYKQCEMTAVDPVSKVNKDLVEKVPGARFIEATIGAQNGTQMARIKQGNRVYEKTTTFHYGITSFIKNYNGNKTIDLLLLDIEGGEFGVLPQLIDDKDQLPTICQMNVEIHYSTTNSALGNDEVLANIHKFLAGGTYSVFNIEVWRMHLRVFLVNTASQECVEKLFC